MKFTPAAAILTSASPRLGDGVGDVLVAQRFRAAARMHSNCFQGPPARRATITPDPRRAVTSGARALLGSRSVMAGETLEYQIGFGNEFATEALAGRAADRAEQSAASPPTASTPRRSTARRSRRRARRAGARGRIGSGRLPCTSRSGRSTAGSLRSAPFDEVPASPNQLRWRPLPIPKRTDGFRPGHRHVRRQRRSRAAVRRRDAHVRRQRVDGRPLLLRRRRRAADRAAARRARSCAPSSASCTSRPARSASCRAASSSASRSRATPRAATSARTTARTSACPSSGRSARMASRTRAISWRPSPRTRSATATSASSRNSSAGSGRPKIDHSPLDVVAWHGTYAPYKYDLARFNSINTVTYDHPDPSIYCVLAAPSAIAGTSNIEFALIADRWSVARNTFRPPPFHRNVCSEFVGLVQGRYIGKRDGFEPGCASLHNCMIGPRPGQRRVRARHGRERASRSTSRTR